MKPMHKPTPDLFLCTGALDASLSALALLAMRDTGAESSSYFRRNDKVSFIRCLGLGTFTTEGLFSERESDARASFRFGLQILWMGLSPLRFRRQKHARIAGHG